METLTTDTTHTQTDRRGKELNCSSRWSYITDLFIPAFSSFSHVKICSFSLFHCERNVFGFCMTFEDNLYTSHLFGPFWWTHFLQFFTHISFNHHQTWYVTCLCEQWFVFGYIAICSRLPNLWWVCFTTYQQPYLIFHSKQIQHSCRDQDGWMKPLLHLGGFFFAQREHKYKN